MRILIDIGHPAHVHLFKNFAHRMMAEGHQLLFTLRDKEFEKNLVEKEGFNYISIGKKYNSLSGKILGLICFTYKLWCICRKYRPDILLSHGSIYAAWVSFFIHKPHIALEDTYNIEQVRLYRPFTNFIITGNYPHPRLSKREFRIASYHELAYLHPTYFTPSPSIYKELDLQPGTPYIIVRFVAWNASHDTGHCGMSLENKHKALKALSSYGKVFISSESPLQGELAQYRLPTKPEQIHQVIASATLLFGESGTMAEEAAMLGVPSIFIYPKPVYYTQHLESEYELLYHFDISNSEQLKAIEKAVNLLQDSHLHEKWKCRRDWMLKEKIDITALLCWIVTHYPYSKKLLLQKPNYQYHFM